MRSPRLGRRASLATLLGAALAHRPGQARLATPLPPVEDPPDSPLRPLGTLVLDAAALGGGGLSGLRAEPDGTLWMVSDLGRWARARLLLAPDGTPLGLAEAAHGPLRDPQGRPLPRRAWGDAEALARIPGGGWAVAFERRHRLWRYDRLDGPATPLAAPPGMERLPANGGVESLAVLADGRWLMLAEQGAPPGEPGLRPGWIGRPGAWSPLLYRPARGMVPTDLCPLPDGGALVLERRFAWTEGFSGRVARLAAPGSGAGPLSAETLLRLGPPLPTDNWEGVATLERGGRTLVLLLSDDNETWPQRSLLMVLAWAGAPGAGGRPSA